MTILQPAQVFFFFFASPRRKGVPSCPCSPRSSLILLGAFSVWDHLSCRAFGPNSKQTSWHEDMLWCYPPSSGRQCWGRNGC